MHVHSKHVCVCTSTNENPNRSPQKIIPPSGVITNTHCEAHPLHRSAEQSAETSKKCFSTLLQATTVRTYISDLQKRAHGRLIPQSVLHSQPQAQLSTLLFLSLSSMQKCVSQYVKLPPKDGVFYTFHSLQRLHKTT